MPEVAELVRVQGMRIQAQSYGSLRTGHARFMSEHMLPTQDSSTSGLLEREPSQPHLLALRRTSMQPDGVAVHEHSGSPTKPGAEPGSARAEEKTASAAIKARSLYTAVVYGAVQVQSNSQGRKVFVCILPSHRPAFLAAEYCKNAVQHAHFVLV